MYVCHPFLWHTRRCCRIYAVLPPISVTHTSVLPDICRFATSFCDKHADVAGCMFAWPPFMWHTRRCCRMYVCHPFLCHTRRLWPIYASCHPFMWHARRCCRIYAVFQPISVTHTSVLPDLRLPPISDVDFHNTPWCLPIEFTILHRCTRWEQSNISVLP